MVGLYSTIDFLLYSIKPKKKNCLHFMPFSFLLMLEGQS